MKVLLVGNGAREHAIAWKLAQSSLVTKLFVAPGNAGTASLGQNVAISAEDIDNLLSFARERNIDFTVVGPEVPLAAGIVDMFQGAGLLIFGPNRAAAKIESSKIFAKELMLKHGVPTAIGKPFDSYEDAKAHIEKSSLPMVVKADGLAAGKGVIVAQSREEAVRAIERMMIEKEFGSAGERVLVEECLEGREVSVFAFVDGEYVSPMIAACDYKRIGEGDVGPNTGGMGSFSPPAFWDDELESCVRHRIMEPVIKGLSSMGTPYSGVLYAGLMLTNEGPKVIEFNCRLGDPETQVILPRLKTDLAEVMMNTSQGKLHDTSIEWSEQACVGVVMASGGYPGKYSTGYTIGGIEEVAGDMIVFHAGTKLVEGGVVTDGGRVLTLTAFGETLKEARKNAYESIKRISFKDSYYRKDIASF